MTTTSQSVRKAIPKINNTVMLSAYKASNQSSLNGNAWNKINLDSVIFDVGSNFDTSTFKFTAPVTGLYRIKGVVYFTSVIATHRYLTALYKNGIAFVYSAGHSSLAEDLSVAVDALVFLTANDYIELYAQPVVGGGVNTVAATGGAGYSTLTARLETKEGIKQ